MCDMFEDSIMCLFVAVVLLTACTSSGDHNSTSVEKSANTAASQAPKGADSAISEISLRIVRRNDQSVVFELTNGSGQPIFLSHVPAGRDGTSTFLSYSLERKVSGEFGEYGEGFHHVPNLHPLDPKRVIQFQLIGYPGEVGEYRVRVAYYEDEEVYRVISQRLTEMTEAEKSRAEHSRKYVFSDTFVVSKPPSKN